VRDEATTDAPYFSSDLKAVALDDDIVDEIGEYCEAMDINPGGQDFPAWRLSKKVTVERFDTMCLSTSSVEVHAATYTRSRARNSSNVCLLYDFPRYNDIVEQNEALDKLEADARRAAPLAGSASSPLGFLGSRIGKLFTAVGADIMGKTTRWFGGVVTSYKSSSGWRVEFADGEDSYSIKSEPELKLAMQEYDEHVAHYLRGDDIVAKPFYARVLGFYRVTFPGVNDKHAVLRLASVSLYGSLEDTKASRGTYHRVDTRKTIDTGIKDRIVALDIVYGVVVLVPEPGGGPIAMVAPYM